MALGEKRFYRFLNTNINVHLYAIAENERDFIDENLEEYNFEGIAFYVEPIDV